MPGDARHHHGDGGRRAEPTRHRREREAADGVDVLHRPEQRRVVAEALEPDQRPCADDERRG